MRHPQPRSQYLYAADLDHTIDWVSRSCVGLNARTRILISGVVQGVFFRREITEHARRLGVTGWVRNLPDGKVEAVAEGDKEKLDELIRFCQVGPSGARVKSVAVDWGEFKSEFRGFKITR